MKIVKKYIIKILTIISVLVIGQCLPLFLAAQNTSKIFKQSNFQYPDTTFKVHLCAHGGLLVSSFVGSQLSNLAMTVTSQPLLGFQGGIALSSLFSKKYGFRHHLRYLQQGAQVEVSDTQQKAYKSTFRIHTLQLAPLNLFYHHKNWQLSLGPYLGFLIAATIQRKNENGQIVNDSSIFGTPEQLSNYAQKIDLGIQIQISYYWCSVIESTLFYQRGLLSVVENAAAVPGAGKPAIPQPAIFNHVLGFSLGYIFNK
ncbi:MAG: outer membrane beta-barrel protein [Bacteroidia bacterium]|nr:PorT family protein [Bacteroidia bacterium]MDW8159096.1 outer membrane beta-barrel protein [Bacteroidia bacterium]